MEFQDLQQTTDTLPMRDFCYLQHLKYVGHAYRPDTSEVQKQAMLVVWTSRKIWTRLERMLDIGVQQARRMMLTAGPQFQSRAPRPVLSLAGKYDDDDDDHDDQTHLLSKCTVYIYVQNIFLYQV